MSNPYFTEDDRYESDEAYEYDEYDESDEAARPRRRNYRPVRPTPAPARPAGNYVTQVQFQSALTDLRRQINAEQARQAGVLRKEIADRKKDVESTRGDVRQLRDISTLLPLISQPSSVTVSAAGATPDLPAGTKVLVDRGDTFSTLLPLLLLSGIGTSGSSGGSGSNAGGLFGGGDNSILPLVLILTLTKK